LNEGILCSNLSHFNNFPNILWSTKADTSTELEEPEDVEKLTGVTSLNLMGASGNVIATVRDISNTEGEKYYFYNKDMRESTTKFVTQVEFTIRKQDYII